MKSLIEFLFGCRHSRTSFPQTKVNLPKRTYVVCLDCGREFVYDWANMKLAKKQPPVQGGVGEESRAAEL